MQNENLVIALVILNILLWIASSLLLSMIFENPSFLFLIIVGIFISLIILDSLESIYTNYLNRAGRV